MKTIPFTNYYRILLVIIGLSTASAFAESPLTLNPDQLKAFSDQMQKMQHCMNSIDQNAVKALESKANEVKSAVKSLCADGKPQQAQARAIAFGKEIANDPSVKKLAQCGEALKSVIPNMESLDQKLIDSLTKQDVCNNNF